MQTYTTQMDAARKGIVTPQMETVAKKEYRTVEEIRQLVAEGKVAIPANKHHQCLNPEGIGSMLRTKINVNPESTLSYLGIGLGIETPSLGLILSKVRGFFLDYPYLLVFPASIVSIISISFYIMGNAFSDAADPRNHV